MPLDIALHIIILIKSALLIIILSLHFSLLACWVILLSKSTFSQKFNLLGIPSEWQTVCIQIRPDVLSGLIWVQVVCKGFQQARKITTRRLRVNQKAPLSRQTAALKVSPRAPTISASPSNSKGPASSVKLPMAYVY